MTDRLLLSAAGLFAAQTAWASMLATREPPVPGEPLGIQPPGSVETLLALGWGAGIAAPWPMPAAAVWAATQAAPGSSWPARTVASVGTMVIVGTMIEPVTWGRRPASHPARIAIAVNLACGVAMILAGRHRLTDTSWQVIQPASNPGSVSAAGRSTGSPS